MGLRSFQLNPVLPEEESGSFVDALESPAKIGMGQGVLFSVFYMFSLELKPFTPSFLSKSWITHLSCVMI